MHYQKIQFNQKTYLCTDTLKLAISNYLNMFCSLKEHHRKQTANLHNKHTLINTMPERNDIIIKQIKNNQLCTPLKIVLKNEDATTGLVRTSAATKLF